jgi:2-oxoglutarate dehydrogenase complex dehydrogenase (E1) component-like enzyme
VSLIHNPSHLEAANPVALGKTRAKIDSGSKVLCLTVHGDAAMSAQGVVPETYQLANLRGYTTGGVLHIVVNNQVGYTTEPNNGRSSRYATDLAKSIGAPIIHVNGNNPEVSINCPFVLLFQIIYFSLFPSSSLLNSFSLLFLIDSWMN